ncbi:LacI family DNA-binding transcriptional regulator [Nakamurella leprariae]|uniref:LacI family DNA-binding transcriptional regulator n=1 Tax=Nakamurella leprariae TaxID=2803911 RepID=A0A938YF28_9ACTN|nr:LacI family DNA-binding transcriptional regulator [Nakamurella leprariae]MBM9468366.1 LacI family DNA-binding transcriptional regulator [Nakamurella leprariae]
MERGRTMADVARVAGVSLSTVSHVVNGTRSVTPATEQLVRIAIEQLGYRRNTVARALATSRTMMVGVCVPVTANSTFPVLVDTLEQRLTAHGYTVVLHNTRDDPAVQHRVMTQLLDLRADGILLAPAPRPHGPTNGSVSGGDPDATLAVRSGTPLVLLDRFSAVPCDQVASEGATAVDRLTTHLADRGHRRIAVVGGLPGLATTVDRLDGHRRAVIRLGLDDDPRLVVAGASDVEVTRTVVRDLFASADRPTAVVPTNNVMTIGTMRGLADLGLAVPQDVALACFDDFEWADVFTPRLTTMGQDLVGMADRAVAMLLQRIAEPDAPPRQELVPTDFRHRDSCGCGATPG